MYSYDSFENEDGTRYVNEYCPDDSGTLRRETIYDGLTDDEAQELVSMLERYAAKRVDTGRNPIA